MNNLLSLNEVTKSYPTPTGPLTVLEGVNFQAEEGQKIFILGPSGAGKSTFLHIAGLLDTPTKGEISVQGQPTHKLNDDKLAKLRAETFGFIYQRHHLMENFTALENVMMPARILGDKNKLRAKALLDEVGLSGRFNHTPSQLSGGEQQRVSLARALMNKPKILLADEPTGSLDAATAHEVETILNQLVKEQGMTLIMVTHNEKLVKKGDIVYRMEQGQLIKK